MGKNNGGVSSNTHSTSDLNHYANSNNPNSQAYRDNNNNHSNQLNPNNDKFNK